MAANSRMMLVTTVIFCLGLDAVNALYKDPVYGVKFMANLTYAQGLVCGDALNTSTCTPFDLKLDVYLPVQNNTGPSPPKAVPAYILSHGGGNTGGSKEQACFQESAQFFTSRGFAAFNIDYRLSGQHGRYPPSRVPPSPPRPGPVQPVTPGTRLVTFIGRNNDYFNPHPVKMNSFAAGYNGLIYLNTTSGSVCIDRAADGSVTLEACVPSAESQQWSIDSLKVVSQQKIRHISSGACLDVPFLSTASAGKVVATSPCANAVDFEIGYSGAVLLYYQKSMLSIGAQLGAQHQLSGWNPTWSSGYPAVRDLKAAIRYVRAMSATYGIDASRIVVSGGSAGATNSIAAGVVFEDDYKSELTAEEDPTLASTHLEQNSSIQCVVTHWSSDGEILFAQEQDPANKTRYGPNNAPVIEFHGSVDTTINISHAYAEQAAYNKTGVPYTLKVLEGCGHSAWCYNGKGDCNCYNGVAGYNPTMDTIALPFVAEQLKLPLD